MAAAMKASAGRHQSDTILMVFISFGTPIFIESLLSSNWMLKKAESRCARPEAQQGLRAGCKTHGDTRDRLASIALPVRALHPECETAPVKLDSGSSIHP